MIAIHRNKKDYQIVKEKELYTKYDSNSCIQHNNTLEAISSIEKVTEKELRSLRAQINDILRD